MAGFAVTIENRVGSIRSGTEPDGTPWKVRMKHAYGYIRRTVGADGDQIDVILGPNRDSQFVVIANQHDAIGGFFDEHKLLLGFNSLAAAKAAYRSMYVGRFVPRPVFKTTSIQRLKEWIKPGMTWGAFHFGDTRGLTAFDRVMNKPLEKPEEEKRTSLGKIAAVLGGGAVAAFAAHKWSQSYNKARAAALHSSLTRPNSPNFDPAYIVRMKAAQQAEKAAQKTVEEETEKRVKEHLEKKTLSAKIRLVQFAQGRHADDGTFMVGVDPFSHYRRASRAVPWINRGAQAAGDLGDMAAGKEVKNPFYKKSWFKRAVQTAAVSAPSMALALGVHRRSAIMHGDLPIGAGRTDGRIAKAAGWVGKKVDEGILDRLPGATRIIRRYAAKIKAIELVAKGRQRLVELDYYDGMESGWDLRDPRGKSARVFAPGSNKRQRREKTPEETIGYARKMRNLAAAAALLGVGGAAYYRGKVGTVTKKAAIDVGAATNAAAAHAVEADRLAALLKKKHPKALKFKPAKKVQAAARVHPIFFIRRTEDEETRSEGTVRRWIIPAATVTAAAATVGAAAATRTTARQAGESAKAATAAIGHARQIMDTHAARIHGTVQDASRITRNVRTITGAIANPLRKIRASGYLWRKRLGLEDNRPVVGLSRIALGSAAAGMLAGATAGVYSAARSGRKVGPNDDLRGVTVTRPFGKKAWLPASHVGIGLPNGNIAHVVRSKGEARKEGRYRVVESSLGEFAGGTKVRARDRVAPAAARRARSVVGVTGENFKTLTNNCETVVDSIRKGNKEGVSKQVVRGAVGGAIGGVAGGALGYLAKRKFFSVGPLDRLRSATKRSVPPVREMLPEIPGQDVAVHAVKHKKIRDLAVRVAAAGGVLGAGVALGHWRKRPILGSLAGGLGAGLVLRA